LIALSKLYALAGASDRRIEGKGMKMISLDEAEKLDFIYDDEDPEGIKLWGVLKCENPEIFVRLRKTPNHYVGFGLIFVVHFYGRRFGFITGIDDEKYLSHKRDDGTFVWIFRHMCFSISIPDMVNGRTVNRYHGGGDRFDSIEEQEIVVKTFERALKNYGSIGFHKSAPGALGFSDEVQQKISYNGNLVYQQNLIKGGLNLGEIPAHFSTKINIDVLELY